MSRFLEKKTLSLEKNNDLTQKHNFPFLNVYASEEDGVVYLNMEAVPELTKHMKSHRDIALIVDLSGSMRPHFKNNSVQKMCEEIVDTLAPHDADGIDILFFASGLVYEASVKTSKEVALHIQKATKARGAFGTTMPIEAFRSFTDQLRKKGTNGTVLFLTDGSMDDKGKKLKEFYQNVLHTEFKTRDRFYCYAIEFGQSASGALKVLDGLYQPEQGPEDLFDLFKTNSLSKISDVLSQVASMSSVSSDEVMSVSVSSPSGIHMVNQILLQPSLHSFDCSIYKVMSFAINEKNAFTFNVAVNGFTPMTIEVNRVGAVWQTTLKPLNNAYTVTRSPVVSSGQKVNVEDYIQDLSNVHISLEWDKETQSNLLLDMQAFLLGHTEKVPNNDCFLFFNQPHFQNGIVSLQEAEDNMKKYQNFSFNLDRIPLEVQSILLTGVLHDAKRNNLTFNKVRNLNLKIKDGNRDTVLTFPLSEVLSLETSAVFGKLYRHQGKWRFQAVGGGYYDELQDFCLRYGVRL